MFPANSLVHRQCSPATLPRVACQNGQGAGLSALPARTHIRSAAVKPARKIWCQAAETEPATVPIEQSSTSFKAVKDIEEITKILPHRFPFLLLDRVVEYEAQKYAVGYKNITVNDQFFPGHFPQRAIMPGVLQVEAMAQLGGIVMMDPDNAAQQNNFFFGGIDACKFRKPVVPGDTLMMRVELTKFNKRFGVAKMDAKAYVGKDLVCEAELTLIMGK